MNEFQKRIISSIILIPLTFLIIMKGSILFFSFLFFCFLISCYEWKKMVKTKKIFILGFIFLSFSFYSAFSLRESSQEMGLFIFLFLIIISVSTDIGGFIFGKIFKGPKLTKISPNKTYAGVIGSFLFSILTGIFFIKYYQNIDSNEIQFNYNFIFLICILSLISQIGDLIISYFKRLSKIDNTGQLIPGHGGILDRIDGMIFVIPFFYIFNLLIKII